MMDETIVRHSKRKICDKFTDIVATQLHYFDRIDEIDFASCRADDLMEMKSGAISRYRNDVIFHRKVDSIVAQLMQSLDD